MPQLRRYSLTKLCDGAKIAIFFCPVFSASRVYHISEVHSKVALRPHHVWKEVWQTSNLRLLRLGKEKKERRKIEIKGQKYNGLPSYIGRL